MTYQELKSFVELKEYRFFDFGDYNLNFIWIRTNDQITNYFTDLLYVAYRVNGEEKLIIIPATTKPGIKGGTDSPITYEGITGTAVIVPGQYSGAWKFIDSYSGFSSYPYFSQVKPISYWRDGDKDLLIDEVQLQEGKIFGTHWHRMSQNGVTGYPINNWSLGCMGAEEPYFKKLLPVIREAVKRYGACFTGTIIKTYK